MKKQLLIAGIALTSAAALAVGGGTFASFVDNEVSQNTEVIAGTLDLVVGGTALSEIYNASNAAPGDSDLPGKGYVLTNSGTLPGKLRVNLVKDADAENTCTEPEGVAEPTCAGDTNGELDNWMKVQVDGNSFGFGGTTPWLGLANAPVGGSVDITSMIWGGTPGPITIAAGGQYPTPGFELLFGWGISGSATNVIQSDSLAFHLEFILEQL
jgi:predicted ribosomally synthesized peptide with SipW-like signal peptide